MPQPMPNLFGRASAVVADHARLRTNWKRLVRLIDTPGTAPERSLEIKHLIREFGSELRLHFTAEEAGGYFHALLEELPQLRPQVDRLRAEHVQITAAVAELETAGNAIEASEFEARVRSLLEFFDRHERAEAQLLQDFFTRDEGGEGQ